MRRAGFHTGRDDVYPDLLSFLEPLVDPVETERAFFHHALGPRGERPGFPGLSVRRLVLVMIRLFLLRLVVKAPCPVRAGHHAILAADASPEILDNDPVLPLEGGLCRTDRDARRMFTLHARHGDDFRPNMGVFSPGHGDHLMPEDFSPRMLLLGRSVGDVILLLAGDNARLAPDTFVQIDHHAPFCHRLPSYPRVRVRYPCPYLL